MQYSATNTINVRHPPIVLIHTIDTESVNAFKTRAPRPRIKPDALGCLWGCEPWLLILTIGTFQNSFSNTLFLVPSWLSERFASPETAKCVRSYSKFWCPGFEGVEAFSVDWVGENNRMVPPVYLISRSILHLEVFRAHGVVVVLKWPSAAFGSLFFIPVEGLRAFLCQVFEFPDPFFFFFFHLPAKVKTQFFVHLYWNLRFFPYTWTLLFCV